MSGSKFLERIGRVTYTYDSTKYFVRTSCRRATESEPDESGQYDDRAQGITMIYVYIYIYILLV